MKMPKKILLVEPEPRVSHIVRQALNQVSSCCIREEHDEASALQSVRWFQPDLIVVDCNGGAVEAEAVAQKWRAAEKFRQIPVLCVKELRPECRFVSAGIVSGYSFLAGPFRFDQLLRAVEQLLSNG